MFGGVFSERQELIRATVSEFENSPRSQNNVDSCNSSKKEYIGPFIHDDVEIYTISLPNKKGESTNINSSFIHFPENCGRSVSI